MVKAVAVSGRVAAGKDRTAPVDTAVVAAAVDILIIKPPNQKTNQKSQAVGKISEGQGGVMPIQHPLFSLPSLLKAWEEETCLQICRAVIKTVAKITPINALTIWAEWTIWVVAEWTIWGEDLTIWEAGLNIWVVDLIIWGVAQITWVGGPTIWEVDLITWGVDMITWGAGQTTWEVGQTTWEADQTT